MKIKIWRSLISLFPFFSLTISKSSIRIPTCCPNSESLQILYQENIIRNQWRHQFKVIESHTYLACSSGTVDTLFWQYCTISENNRANPFKLTSFFPLLIERSRMVVFSFRDDIFFYYNKLMEIYSIFQTMSTISTTICA